jgi:hypothetical protein
VANGAQGLDDPQSPPTSYLSRLPQRCNDRSGGLTTRRFEEHQHRFFEISTALALGGFVQRFDDVPRGQKLYRGVRHEQQPSTVDLLHHPPAELVKEHQRFNRPGEPRFYASAASAGAIYEIMPNPGTHLAISEWTVTREFWPLRIGYHPKVFEGWGSQRPRVTYTRFIDIAQYRTNPAVRYLQKFIAEEVTRVAEAEHEYKLSIAIGETLVGANRAVEATDIPPGNRIAAIAYPALKLLGSADNIAMFPEEVSRCLKVTQAWYIRIDQVHEPVGYSFTILDRADTFDDLKIMWQGDLFSSVPEHQRRQSITFEGGYWITSDGAGNEIDRH